MAATLKQLRSNSISYSSDKMTCSRKSSRLKKCDRWMKIHSFEFAQSVRKHCMLKLLNRRSLSVQRVGLKYVSDAKEYYCRKKLAVVKVYKPTV